MSEKKTPPHNAGSKHPDSPQQTPPVPENKPAPAAPQTAAPHKNGQVPEKPPAPSAKPADGGIADKPVNPPPVHRAPAGPPAKSGNMLGLIALAVSVAALGGSFVLHSMQAGAIHDESALLKKTLASADSVAANESAIAALRSDLAAVQTPGMDRASVMQALAENSDGLTRQMQEQIAALQSSLDKRLAELPKTLERGDVQSLVKQELATFAQTLDGNRPALDFSDEIAKVQTSEANAKQVLAQIEQSAAQLDGRIRQALADAEKRLSNMADSQSSLINLLSLAQLAGHAGQYQAAAQYLQQAAALLPGTEQASWQGAVNDAAQTYRELSTRPAPAGTVDGLIARVGEWPLRDSGAQNLLAADAEARPQTFMDTVRQVGNDILASTVTVTPLDDEGMAWINHNPALQNIIRQNVRLDLAFARNALQMRDKAAFTQITATLKGQIERYFDTGNADVAAALETLARLDGTQTDLPDLAPMIQTLRNAR